MRCPLAALALAGTLALGTLPAAPAAGSEAVPEGRGWAGEIWTALRVGWLGFWEASEAPTHPSDSVVLAVGAGVDPNGLCAPPACAPPPGTLSASEDPDR